MIAQKNLEVKNNAKASGKKGNIEKMLIDAIDSVLSSLGEQFKQSIYFHLRNRYGINRAEIPEKIEGFEDALGEMLGSGAKLIQIRVMELLFSKVPTFKYVPKQQTLLFADYVKEFGGF